MGDEGYGVGVRGERGEVREDGGVRREERCGER